MAAVLFCVQAAGQSGDADENIMRFMGAESLEDIDEENIDDIINNLPEEFQQPETGIAPVSVAGSSTSFKSSRPDTKNSNSIRKVEGLAGREYDDTSSNNQSIISNALSGNYSGAYSSNGSYYQQNQ